MKKKSALSDAFTTEMIWLSPTSTAEGFPKRAPWAAGSKSLFVLRPPLQTFMNTNRTDQIKQLSGGAVSVFLESSLAQHESIMFVQTQILGGSLTPFLHRRTGQNFRELPLLGLGPGHQEDWRSAPTPSPSAHCLQDKGASQSTAESQSNPDPDLQG